MHNGQFRRVFARETLLYARRAFCTPETCMLFDESLLCKIFGTHVHM